MKWVKETKIYLSWKNGIFNIMESSYIFCYVLVMLQDKQLTENRDHVSPENRP